MMSKKHADCEKGKNKNMLSTVLVICLNKNKTKTESKPFFFSCFTFILHQSSAQAVGGLQNLKMSNSNLSFSPQICSQFDIKH